MTNDHSPEDCYRKQLDLFTTQLTALQKRRASLGWIRALVFIATIALSAKIFSSYGWIGLLPAVVGIAFLLYLVSLDLSNNEKIRNTKVLIRLNEEELRMLANQYSDRDDGSRFQVHEHAYAADLDIFGPSSLYQWLSRCYTEQGCERLAANLLQPLSVETILERQEAIKEIGPKLAWRQQWQAFAMLTRITKTTAQRLESWLEGEEKSFLHPAWKIVVLIYSMATLATGIAAIIGYIPASLFSTLFLLYVVISLSLSTRTIKPYIHLNGIAKEAGTIQNLIAWLESAEFSSAYLKKLQQSIKGHSASASKEISSLKKILDAFDLRSSIAGLLFLNPFLLWDVRQMIALNQWRQRNENLVKGWFAAIAEMEVLHSLSTLHFNRPRWCFPHFVPTHFTLEGKNIGHPLLPENQRVSNDFSMEGLPGIGLITGSNMAGKSTFLRSIGVNIVLGQIGSVVCATQFFFSPVHLLSSMRIADNLAENTSTFYAELKKLRTIIESVKAHQRVFILLDEILRGTNSYDRHKGAAALIKQLIKENAVALIATHDVELAQLETVDPDAVSNYHFDVQIEGEELYFDYKLKKGVCRSLNASLLMKKIGIDLS